MWACSNCQAKTMNNFTCSHVDAEFQGWACRRGAGCFQSILERCAQPPNTVFDLRREALVPLVYFNSNFYVRNTTWNADTGERRVRENAWHLIIQTCHARMAALSQAHNVPTFLKAGEMRVLALEYSRALTGHNGLKRANAPAAATQSRSHIS